MEVIKIIYAFLQNIFVPNWGGWSPETILLILATKKKIRYSKNKTGHVRRRNIKVSSRNYWCYWKALSIICSEGVSVALDTQYAKHMRHTVICGLSGSTLFFHIIS